MVPHDQQVEVTWPGMIREDVDLVSGFAIDRFTTTAHPAPWVHTVQGRSAVVQGSEVSLQRLADKSVRPHIKP
jgi:hypothetical protein